MLFTPACIGRTALPKDVLAADKKACKRFGSCGVGEQAIYLGSYFIGRSCYVAFSSVRRVYKRVAMSRGGFTGKGVFGSVSYLVVEYDDGQEKQCNLKREEDVDLLLAHLAQVRPELPRLSAEGERRMAEKQAREATRYLKELTPQAQSAREELEEYDEVVAVKPMFLLCDYR